MPFFGNREHREVNPWLIAIAVMSSTFMEVLDTTVVNVSLPHIAGSLSATNDEATWTLTSYLVANAIILPMTGWLAGRFGRKRLLMMSVTGFTVASFLCGLAPSLPFLILCRVIQGACGGGLQPLSQAILLESFPAGEAWAGDGFLGARHRRRAHARPGRRRLAHRQLQLALGLLHQHSDRHHRAHPHRSFHLRSALSAPPENRHRLLGHRPADRRHWQPADHARQGSGGRLVRLALHRDLGRARRRRPHRPHHSRTHHRASHPRSHRLQIQRVCHWHLPDDLHRIRALRQHRSAAAADAGDPRLHRDARRHHQPAARAGIVPHHADRRAG